MLRNAYSRLGPWRPFLVLFCFANRSPILQLANGLIAARHDPLARLQAIHHLEILLTSDSYTHWAERHLVVPSHDEHTLDITLANLLDRLASERNRGGVRRSRRLVLTYRQRDDRYREHVLACIRHNLRGRRKIRARFGGGVHELHRHFIVDGLILPPRAPRGGPCLGVG